MIKNALCFLFQANIVKDFNLNEVYNQCKKTLPKTKKPKDADKEKKDN